MFAAHGLKFVENDFKTQLKLSPLEGNIVTWAQKARDGKLSVPDLARWEPYAELHPEIKDPDVVELFSVLFKFRIECKGLYYSAEKWTSEVELKKKLDDALSAYPFEGCTIDERTVHAANKLVRLVASTPCFTTPCFTTHTVIDKWSLDFP